MHATDISIALREGSIVRDTCRQFHRCSPIQSQVSPWFALRWGQDCLGTRKLLSIEAQPVYSLDRCRQSPNSTLTSIVPMYRPRRPSDIRKALSCCRYNKARYASKLILTTVSTRQHVGTVTIVESTAHVDPARHGARALWCGIASGAVRRKSIV